MCCKPNFDDFSQQHRSGFTIASSWHVLATCLALLFIVCTSALCASVSKEELEANALLSDAEQLIEAGQHEKALPILDQVQTMYPRTGAAQYAQLRRAFVLMYTDENEEAEQVARELIAKHQDSLLAAWAQAVVGEAMVRRGAIAEGIRELLQVHRLLPGRSDIGPLEMARGVIGRVLTTGLADDADPVQAMASVGLDAQDTWLKAQVLAIVAVYRMKQDRLDLANPIVDRIARECPEEREAWMWAATEIARMAAERTDEHADNAAQVLSQLCASAFPGEQASAKAHLSLSRYYRRQGRRGESIAVLRSAMEKCKGTVSDPEILFELGSALCREGKAGEGLDLLNRIVEQYPASGYVPPALYTIGMHYSVSKGMAVNALTTLAEGPYNETWRGLALWRLGTLLQQIDKVRARNCYTQAVQIFESRLARGIADPNPTWANMLEARINNIRRALERLDAGGGRK